MSADWIVADAAILGGKRCIRGTRISVELVLELIAGGASVADVQRQYPHVPAEGIAAAVAYAAQSLKVDLR